MNDRLHGPRRVLVTGSTHGIGFALSSYLLARGVQVYGCARTPGDPKIAQLEARFPGAYHHTIADVSNEDQVRTLLDWCCAEGPLDAVVNCAGIGCKPAPIHLLNPADARQVLAVNLLGTAYCMKHALLHMKAPGGTIINCGSVAGKRPGTGADWSYSASKAGVEALTREAAHSGLYPEVYFVLLNLGFIETRMTAADDKSRLPDWLPQGRWGRPEEVAQGIWQLLTHPKPGKLEEYSMIGGGFYDL